MHCGELCDRLDDLLRTDAYADIDASANGLQVGTRTGEIEHVAVAVDAAVETADRAAEAGADLLLAHHGVLFGGFDRLTGRDYERVRTLVEHDLRLYVSHLPLDGHQRLGNAAGVADLLDLDEREPFGTMGSEVVGQRGRLPEAVPVGRLRERLAAELDTGGQGVQALDFGPAEVRRVAIVTGSGVDWLDEAVAVGADVLVTGEGKQHVYHEAREAGISVLLAGHYATETFGVQRLATRIAEWGPTTTALDCPTGL